MKCDKCSDDYILIDDETNICHLKTECDNQNCYEVDEFHYYTCSKTNENCEKCEKIDSDIICNECKADFRLSNNVCYPVIQNRKTYEDTGNQCSVYKDGFTFEGNDRTSCKNLIEFIEYYSKDNGISNLKCDDTENGGIQNCGTCQYNSDNNQLICKHCKADFILKYEETETCYSNSDCQNNNEYYLKMNIM